MSAVAEAAPAGFHPASRLYRFVVLFFVALLLYGSYFAYDSIGALTPLIIDDLGIGREQIGMLYSFYSWPNVVMVFIGGLLTDRFGTRKMSLIFSGLIVVGAVVVAAAPMLASGITAFWWMLAGRTIFGIGSESLVICQNAIVAKWFKGKELALAFGLTLTFSRLGTLFSFNTEAAIARHYGDWVIALWAAVLFCGVSLLSNFVYVFLERRALGQVTLGEAPAGEKVVLADIKLFGPSYWFIAALCVTFYSAIFPFTAFSTDFFHEKWGYSVESAGRLSSLIIFASMMLSPVLGGVVDKIGRRGTMMLAGSLLLVPGFLTLGFTEVTPVAPMVVLGLAFSLVPAALWPAVPLIVPEKAVGTAFGLITMIQNFGLAAFPWLVGSLRDATQSYTAGMAVFAALGLLGFIFAGLLKRADARAGGRLEAKG